MQYASTCLGKLQSLQSAVSKMQNQNNSMEEKLDSNTAVLNQLQVNLNMKRDTHSHYVSNIFRIQIWLPHLWEIFQLPFTNTEEGKEFFKKDDEFEDRYRALTECSVGALHGPKTQPAACRAVVRVSMSDDFIKRSCWGAAT